MRSRLVRCVLASVLLGCAAGCATKVKLVGKGSDAVFRHRSLGYEIDQPQLPKGEWKRALVDGTDLAFRSGAGASMSLLTECARAIVSPVILARHLVIGLPERQLEHSAPVAHLGLGGWSQTFETEGVLVKTVSLAGSRCSFDWVLVAPFQFDRWQPIFDSWWQSFRPPVYTDAEDGEL